MVERLTVLDLFSAAAGGWSLGMHRAGFTTIAACEIEAWRRAIYSENNPGVKVYDDVRTLTAARLLDDLGCLPSFIVGSPPCQDISSANTSGKGVEGERSGLFFEAIRLVDEIRPRWVALENSANLRTRGADAVLAALETIGYTGWPVVVRAGDIGANHERPRVWVIACDVEQVTDADGFGWLECIRRGLWFDLSVSGDPAHPDHESQLCGAVDAEMGELSGLGNHRGGNEAAHTDGDALRFAIVPGGSEPETPVAGDDARQGRNATDAGEPIAIGRDALGGRRGRPEGAQEERPLGGSESATGNTPNPDQAGQAGQADGCLEPGLRQAEIANDGRGTGRSADEPRAGQMGLCSPDSGDADRSGPDWSLAHLADHLRLDDGLSARLAGTRVDVGDGKGQSAASLVVEAFGDAVIPQIPEAIGRAILRTEAALATIYQRRAA